MPLSFPSSLNLLLVLCIHCCLSVPLALETKSPARTETVSPWLLLYPTIWHIVGALQMKSLFAAVFPVPRTAPGT